VNISSLPRRLCCFLRSGTISAFEIPLLATARMQAACRTLAGFSLLCMANKNNLLTRKKFPDNAKFRAEGEG